MGPDDKVCSHPDYVLRGEEERPHCSRCGKELDL